MVSARSSVLVIRRPHVELVAVKFLDEERDGGRLRRTGNRRGDYLFRRRALNIEPPAVVHGRHQGDFGGLLALMEPRARRLDRSSLLLKRRGYFFLVGCDEVGHF